MNLLILILIQNCTGIDILAETRTKLKKKHYLNNILHKCTSKIRFKSNVL